jgi:hypothetical protein
MASAPGTALLHFIGFAAHHVDRLVTTYADHPGEQATFIRLVVGTVFPDFDHGILENVFSECSIFHDALDRTQQYRAVVLVDQADGFFVLLPEQSNDPAFGIFMLYNLTHLPAKVSIFTEGEKGMDGLGHLFSARWVKKKFQVFRSSINFGGNAKVACSNKRRKWCGWDQTGARGWLV